MKSQKSHYRQVSYHAYLYTYKLVTKQIEIKNQSKRHESLQNREKLYKKLKFFHENMCKKGIWVPPQLNFTIYSLGTEEPQPRTKKTKPQNAINQTRHKYIQTNT